MSADLFSLGHVGGVAHSTVRDLPEVIAAQEWASGDTARRALVRAAVSSLTQRLYAQSTDALNRPPF